MSMYDKGYSIGRFRCDEMLVHNLWKKILFVIHFVLKCYQLRKCFLKYSPKYDVGNGRGSNRAATCKASVQNSSSNNFLRLC